jgi:hypothetical protein
MPKFSGQWDGDLPVGRSDVSLFTFKSNVGGIIFSRSVLISKDFDKPEEVDREPDPKKKDVPWPVKKGGWVLQLYKYSLTIALLFLFFLSFAAHFYGSLKDENERLSLQHKPLQTAAAYMSYSRFWFESFQNWQSEFLSVLAIVLLSIWLRQKGSPQSKPLDAPVAQTGA